MARKMKDFRAAQLGNNSAIAGFVTEQQAVGTKQTCNFLGLLARIRKWDPARSWWVAHKKCSASISHSVPRCRGCYVAKTWRKRDRETVHEIVSAGIY